MTGYKSNLSSTRRYLPGLLVVGASCLLNFPAVGSNQAFIVGGSKPPAGQMSFMVAVLRSQALPADPLAAQICGATYLGQGWVLTAAHCVTAQPKDQNGPGFPPVGCNSVSGKYRCDYDPKDFVVLVGADQLVAGTEMRVEVDVMHVYPDYGSKLSQEHDIALLKLKSFNDNGLITVRLGAVADETAWQDALADSCRQMHPQEAGQTASCKEAANLVVAGWGARDAAGEEFGPDLLVADVVAKDTERCNFWNGLGASILDGELDPATNNMLCAGWDRLPTGAGAAPDSCWGDSGGFLGFKAADGIFVQVGVVSFGWSCGKPFLYNVYTRVSQYRKWIADTVQ